MLCSCEGARRTIVGPLGPGTRVGGVHLEAAAAAIRQGLRRTMDSVGHAHTGPVRLELAEGQSIGDVRPSSGVFRLLAARFTRACPTAAASRAPSGTTPEGFRYREAPMTTDQRDTSATRAPSAAVRTPGRPLRLRDGPVARWWAAALAGPVATFNSMSTLALALDRVHGAMTGRPEGRLRSPAGGALVSGLLAGILAELRSWHATSLVATTAGLANPAVSVPFRSWLAGAPPEPVAGVLLWARSAAVGGRGF